MYITYFFIALFTLASYTTNAATPNYYYAEMYTYDNQDCYNPNNDDQEKNTISDPFKLLNKHVFYFNAMLDTIIFVPANQIYTTIVPKPSRAYVGNFLNNLAEPINLINSMLQGDFAQARVTFGRFITNSLLGFGGIMDIAREFKLKNRNEDFGKTIAHYGIGSGPYLVAPIIGPTSFRDLTGKVADYYMNPFKYTLTTQNRQAINITWMLQKRADSNAVIKTIRKSLDPYEATKQMYIQYRRNQVNLK